MMNDSRLYKSFRETGKLPIPIIDSHTHMNDIYGTALSVYSAKDSIKLLNIAGVESIWCAPHADLFDPLNVSKKIEEMMRDFPGRIRGYFSFNPNYVEEYNQRIERPVEIDGYIGYKLLPEYHRYPIDSGAYRRALEIANAYNMVVLIHTWGGSPYNDIEHMEFVLKKYKNIQLILGHSAPNRCTEAIKLACDYENVYLDLCDIHRHSGIVEKMVRTAGANKVLFGTDMPWYDPNYCIGSVLSANITDLERERIFFRNQLDILKKIKK